MKAFPGKTKASRAFMINPPVQKKQINKKWWLPSDCIEYFTLKKGCKHLPKDLVSRRLNWSPGSLYSGYIKVTKHQVTSQLNSRPEATISLFIKGDFCAWR